MERIINRKINRNDLSKSWQRKPFVKYKMCEFFCEKKSLTFSLFEWKLERWKCIYTNRFTFWHLLELTVTIAKLRGENASLTTSITIIIFCWEYFQNESFNISSYQFFLESEKHFSTYFVMFIMFCLFSFEFKIATFNWTCEAKIVQSSYVFLSIVCLVSFFKTLYNFFPLSVVIRFEF